MNKTFSVTLAMIALIGWNSNALAGGTIPVVTHVVSRPGQPQLISLKQRGPLVPRDDSQDAGLTPIVNTFTQYKNSPYWGRLGYASCGPQDCAEGTEQWLATAFTPKSNYVATRVEIAAIHYMGANEAVVSIYDDAKGVPGKALHSWTLTNLPGGICCTVVGGSDKRGIPLSAGKQYWIVLSTSPKAPTAVAVWVFTEFADVQKHGTSYAVYCSGAGCTNLGLADNAWHIFTNVLYGFAYSVLGK